MSKQDNFIVSVSTSTSTGEEKEQHDKTNAQEILGKDSGTNTDIPDAYLKEFQLKRIENVGERRPTEIIVIPENEIDSDSKPKKKKKTGGLEKNFKLDMAELTLKDKIAMTNETEKTGKKNVTDSKNPTLFDNKITFDKTQQSARPSAQGLRKMLNRSSSADRVLDIDKIVKSSTSQPIPTTEVEEVVTELETVDDLDIVTRPKSSVILTRTVSRVSSGVSRVSRTVRQLVCCGVTMEVPSDDKLPGREGHAI